MRHVYIRSILALVWLAAAIVSVNMLFAVMAAVFLYSAYTVWKKEMNDIELAAWTHAEFVRIHPFLDGNGRTSRLLMNYRLMENGFLPIYIAKEDRLAYYNALDQYAAHGRLDDFADMIALLEEKKLNQYLKLAAI